MSTRWQKKTNQTTTLVLCIAIVIGWWLMELSGGEAWVRRLIQPPIAAVSQRVVSGLQLLVYPWRVWNSRAESLAQYQALEIQYARSQAAVSELEQLRSENQALRALIASNSGSPTRQLITAPITAYAWPAISLGSEAGVRAGQPVSIAQTVVGIVETVSAQQATVQLLHQVRAPSLVVKTERGVSGILVGDGKQVVMREIPREAVVVRGDRVMTSGQLGMKPGLFIGQIAQVESSPAAPTQVAIIDQGVSFYESTIVEVE